MSAPGLHPDEDDALLAGVRRRILRQARWKASEDASVGRRLTQIGVLGWIIVLPVLAGIFIGRRLDQGFHSGVFWTAPLLLAGLVLGCWSARKWMQSP